MLGRDRWPCGRQPLRVCWVHTARTAASHVLDEWRSVAGRQVCRPAAQGGPWWLVHRGRRSPTGPSQEARRARPGRWAGATLLARKRACPRRPRIEGRGPSRTRAGRNPEKFRLERETGLEAARKADDRFSDAPDTSSLAANALPPPARTSSSHDVQAGRPRPAEP
jgi:hypothetical protein